MVNTIEAVGDILGLLFFLQAFAGLTFLNVLPETFKSIVNDLRFLNFHFTTQSKVASKLLDVLNVDEDCDNAGVFLMNLLAVICVFACILKFRVFQYILSRFQCTCTTTFGSFPILDHPTLEIMACLICFFGLSLSAALASVDACSDIGIRVVAIIILVFLLCGALLVRYLISTACRGGISPPSPLAEFDSKVRECFICLCSLLKF